MSLVEAPVNFKLKISDIQSGMEAKRQLNHIGLHEDDLLIKVNNNKWGPVLIRNLSNGISKIAIGRGLAEKILVEYEG
jgi:Fe2+ transport system protein FeoA